MIWMNFPSPSKIRCWIYPPQGMGQRCQCSSNTSCCISPSLGAHGVREGQSAYTTIRDMVCGLSDLWKIKLPYCDQPQATSSKWETEWHFWNLVRGKSARQCSSIAESGECRDPVVKWGAIILYIWYKADQFNFPLSILPINASKCTKSMHS